MIPRKLPSRSVLDSARGPRIATKQPAHTTDPTGKEILYLQTADNGMNTSFSAIMPASPTTLRFSGIRNIAPAPPREGYIGDHKQTQHELRSACPLRWDPTPWIVPSVRLYEKEKCERINLGARRGPLTHTPLSVRVDTEHPPLHAKAPGRPMKGQDILHDHKELDGEAPSLGYQGGRPAEEENAPSWPSTLKELGTPGRYEKQRERQAESLICACGTYPNQSPSVSLVRARPRGTRPCTETMDTGGKTNPSRGGHMFTQERKSGHWRSTSTGPLRGIGRDILYVHQSPIHTRDDVNG